MFLLVSMYKIVISLYRIFSIVTNTQHRGYIKDNCQINIKNNERTAFFLTKFKTIVLKFWRIILFIFCFFYHLTSVRKKICLSIRSILIQLLNVTETIVILYLLCYYILLYLIPDIFEAFKS